MNCFDARLLLQRECEVSATSGPDRNNATNSPHGGHALCGHDQPPLRTPHWTWRPTTDENVALFVTGRTSDSHYEEPCVKQQALPPLERRYTMEGMDRWMRETVRWLTPLAAFWPVWIIIQRLARIDGLDFGAFSSMSSDKLRRQIAWEAARLILPRGSRVFPRPLESRAADLRQRNPPGRSSQQPRNPRRAGEA